MNRAVLLAAILVLAGGCSLAGDPAPPDGGQVGTLQLCDAGDLPGTVPDGPIDSDHGELPGQELGTQAPPAADPSPGPFIYCLQLVGPNGADDVLQVVARSNQAQAPLADRRVLVYHPGGPGISPVATLVDDPLPIDLDEFLVVAWDGRTASTAPGSCGPVTSGFGLERTEPTAEDAAAIAEECRLPIGSDATVGAARGALELELIRQALGVERVSLLTHSYGTAIAESYLAGYGSHVERAVLDAPIAIDVPWDVRVDAVDGAIGALVDDLLASCVPAVCGAPGDPGGAPSYDRLRQDVMAVGPIVGSSGLTLTGTMFDQATLLALRDDEYWPGFLAGVDEALAGDGTSLWGLGEQQFFDVDRAVYYETMCADLDHPPDVSGFAPDAVSSLTRTYLGDLAPCAAYAPAARPSQRTEGAAGDVVLLASPYDVYAPATMIEGASDLLEGSMLCLTERRGHTSYASPGVADAVGRFLHDGDADAFEDACTDVVRR
jgi:pimeloyl-ACP methyl ester carboxylesterase